MNARQVVFKTLRDTRTATIAVAGTCFGMAFLTVAIFPQFASSFEGVDLPSLYEGFSGGLAITSPEGFMNSEFFSWIPLLLITLAIIAGTGTLAGEEGSGAMDLLLAQPIRRRDVVLAKTIGVTIALLAAVIASLPGMVIAALFVEFDISWSRLVFATLNMAPLTLFYFGIALWASVALPTRGAAVVVAVGAAVVPYLVNTVLAAAATGGAIQKLTPFHWGAATEILKGNNRWEPAAVFLVLFVALVGLTIASFERRDIDVGGWSPVGWIRSHLPGGREQQSEPLEGRPAESS